MPSMTAGQHVTPTIKLVRKLGAGAMGEVWAAENLGLGTQVAVKLMTPGYANDEQAMLRFRREAQAAARIKNPYVATVFDHGTTANGQPYIVMELLEGETLRKRLSRLGPLPCEEVLRLFGQTARGVGAAHKLGVIHRDIKPENLFVIDDEGEPFVKVLDFGIAKQLDVASGLTSTGTSMGTPPYMSPEQFDDTKRVDHRTDLWAMAVVAYELLTGRLPFMGSTLFAMAMTIARGEFEPPSAQRPDLPIRIDEWMARAFSVAPEGRFESAMAMAEALSSAMKSKPGQEPGTWNPPAPRDLVYAPTEPLEVPPTPALGKYDPGRVGHLFQPRKSSAPDEARSGDAPRLDVSDDPRRGLLTLSLPGSWPRSIAFDDRGAVFVAFAMGEVLCFDLASKRPRWWSRLLARPVCLGAAPGFLAVGCTDGKIRVFEAARGIVRHTIAHDTSSIRALAVDPGAGILAACGTVKRISLWRLATGECMQSAEENTEGIRALAFDEKSGLWASGARSSTVRLWDASLRNVHVLRDQGMTVRAVAFAPDGSYLAAGRGDGSVMLWATRGWELKSTLTGHSKRLCSLSFLPGVGISGALVSGSEDGTMRIWQVRSAKTHLTLGSGKGAVECVATSPDGKHVASASADGKVSVYQWPIHPSLTVADVAAK
ncbi:serine/threonine-protein kinase [Polyangium sp. 6x1]|uniref:WD40 repeat domain-containing serine/threonine protein kinase n=1 Tax=Polyangium sp. 6x1 TaxID=3042689 RepID=UPI002482AF09|nr:serine/threonine-protein kinase [Polyangium sp. 6x1]MDI1448597.1 serine/threonine-protein kinase [Polyangium sp. 6x1]